MGGKEAAEKVSPGQGLKEGERLQDTEALKGHVISTHPIIMNLHKVQVIG